MNIINLDAYTNSLKEEIDKLEADAIHFSKNNSYDKAAKLNNEARGIKKAVMIANSGDFNIVRTGTK